MILKNIETLDFDKVSKSIKLVNNIPVKNIKLIRDQLIVFRKERENLYDNCNNTANILAISTGVLFFLIIILGFFSKSLLVFYLCMICILLIGILSYLLGIYANKNYIPSSFAFHICIKLNKSPLFVGNTFKNINKDDIEILTLPI